MIYNTSGIAVRSLTADEQVKIIRAMQLEDPKLFLWFMMFLDLGPRTTELFLVTNGDVRNAFKMPTPALRMRTLKRRKETYRMVPIPTVSHTPCKDINLQELLKAELSDREGDPDTHYWIHSIWQRKKKMYRTRPAVQDNCYNWFQPVYRKLGFFDVTCRTLRHTYAVNLLRKNVPIPVIQRLLGHANMGNTGIYLNPSTEEIFEAAMKESNEAKKTGTDNGT